MRLPIPCLFPFLVTAALAPPAGAEVRAIEIGRFFAGLPALLLVHGEIAETFVWQIEEPEIVDHPDGQGDTVVLRLWTLPRPLGAAAVFDRAIEIPALDASPSRLVVEGRDDGGVRTEYLNREIRPEPPLAIAASRDLLTASETFTVQASFTASEGAFHPGWRREGSLIRLDLSVGCHICPVVIPSERREVESDAIGNLPPGEYTVEVWDRPEAVNQLLHRQQVVVLPDPVELRDGRFRLEVLLDPPHGGEARLAAPPSRDAALFYFFDPANWEILIKVLDGCALNGHFWVFGAASTDVAYTVAVRDLLGGATREYRHPAGSPAPAIVDTAAFACTAGAAGAVP